jgi:hypothetical protein
MTHTDVTEGIDHALIEQDVIGEDQLLDQLRGRRTPGLGAIGDVDRDRMTMVLVSGHSAISSLEWGGAISNGWCSDVSFAARIVLTQILYVVQCVFHKPGYRSVIGRRRDDQTVTVSECTEQALIRSGHGPAESKRVAGPLEYSALLIV